ncbi:MAG: flagellar hook protein FlgE [bacterium]
MMRALFAGVSGLRNHLTRMDVIGNNIANVNTVAFKSSRVTFKEAFVQLVSGASRPSATLGGTNPIQIGTGVNMGSVDQLFSQGSLESTGQPLDLAIQGDAFFVLNNGNSSVYSRAGNLQLDANGNLINPGTGYLVQGINADPRGNFTSGTAISGIHIGLTDKAPAQATSLISLTGNLDSSAGVGAFKSMTTTVYDSTGAPHVLTLSFEKTGASEWSWTADVGGTPPTATVSPAGSGQVTFGPTGQLLSFTYPGGGTDMTITPAGGGLPFDITLDPGTVNTTNGLAGFANPSNAVVREQNGFPAGSLINISVDANGVISGFFDNGVTRSLAQIALATFNNPGGLVRSNDGMYQSTPNSGLAVVGFAGGTSRSTITPGALEGSNVDISNEFTNMIVTQRGFQANARVVTTADEILNDLVNLRR